MKIVSESFVPVTVDQKVLFRDREKHTAEIEAIRTLSNGKPGHLGVYAATADGAPLGLVYGQPNEMLTMLKDALTKNGSVPPRNVQATMINPDRGRGVKPDGSVRLALSVRYMDDGKPQDHPVFASIWLTAPEWAVLVPQEGKAGERYQVPGSVAGRFAEALSGLSNFEYLLKAEDTTEATLAAEVLPPPAGEASDGSIVVRLAGAVAAKRDYLKDPKQPMNARATIEGLLTLDAQRRPQKLIVLLEGAHRQPWGREKPVAAVVDWQAEATPP